MFGSIVWPRNSPLLKSTRLLKQERKVGRGEGQRLPMAFSELCSGMFKSL